MLSLNNKLTQYLIAVLKVAMLILIGIVIYRRLLANEALSFQTFVNSISKTTNFSVTVVSLLLLCTLFNWLLEAKKWQVLASQIAKTTYLTALKQALASHTMTLITPMRAGEYGVKAFYFEKSKRKRILQLNLFGNISQMAVTCFFGLMGGLWLVSQEFPEWLFLSAIACIVSLMLFWFGFKSKLFASLYRLAGRSLVLKASSRKVIVLSVLRYLVFSHQFYVLLLCFDVNLGYWPAMSLIFATYLIGSIVPILSIFDVVLKGGVAVLLFGWFGVPAVSILCVTTVMWLLNIVLPAGVGSVSLFIPKDFTSRKIALIQFSK